VLTAGARVAGAQKKPTKLPNGAAHWPVRVMVLPKQGRGTGMHVPDPGKTSSQSPLPLGRKHGRNV
jgi:hypothetical protein